MANISQKWLNIGSREMEILSVFTGNYSSRMHESGVVKMLNLPQRTVSRKLNNLGKKGILRYVREGKNKIYFLNSDFPSIFQILTLVESYKAINFLENNPKLALVFSKLKCGAIIFGSYAKNHQTSSSDLDIVFLCNKNKELENIISQCPIEMHAQFSSLDNLKEKLAKKDALTLEIEKNHIILKDFENLIKILMDKAHG